VTVLIYHTVENGWRSPLAVTPETFDAHCRWLCTHRSVLRLADAVEQCDARGRLPAGCTSLTFDDGFSGLYDHAFATLLKYGLPATIFLVAETLTDNGRPIDWSSTADATARTLTREEVLEMQEAGIEFGSHSYSHHLLTTLSEDECTRDLLLSREFLEELLGRRVPFLSYPRGLHNDAVRRAARRAGFTHALSLPEGPEPVGPYAVPRAVIVPGNGLAALRLKSSRMFLTLRNMKSFPVFRTAARRLGHGLRVPS
jgi:peptidoglycan/xylan/chitin deacetylase (PgdA/CDA1 family)